MDVRKAVLLAGALIIAITTALMARSMFSGDGGSAPHAAASSMPPAPDGPLVLVATKALPVGTILDAESVRYQPWPKELVENAYFIKGKEDASVLAGSVVRNPITAGQPLTQGTIIRPGDRGFMAAALGPGMRAITVPVSANSSVAGFIFPGDRIDLMLTQAISGGGDSGQSLKVAETILRNLRVLATDQRTDPMDANGKPEVRTYSTVTLEVTPKIAEKIAVAQTVGSLSLSLRSIADNTADLDAAIAGADGSVPLPNSNDPSAEKKALAKIAAGPVDKGSTFATGGDVSRFQRRTVPPAVVQGAVQMGATMGNAITGAVGIGPIVHIARGTTVTDVAVSGGK
ncbi:Flp pilus assembly protein CpaB [Sphingobium subterraneum]|uniref:Pilus assembly protein CpaB n=1 Tax=Sphingobium subterraneum TaxID=627688 RepID=A0A841J372_9SPHN|nr:Flp pilus assembly protein CpaB [Sphingobium subterraneum]MBB6124792.1 pilus assembly protein CpaB [Sphingobium subterraneum]